MSPAVILDHALDIGLFLTVLSVAIGFVRLWRGPGLADRVVTLDMMTSAIIVFCGLFAVKAGAGAFLDIAVALALVSFLSVVALARYGASQIRKSDRGGEDPDA